MPLIIRKIRKTDYSAVAKLIKAFYREDTEGIGTNIKKIKDTFRELLLSPSGEVLVIKKNQIIVGYAILINYWSHEYGGNILHLDELYIKPKYRGQGIGTRLIKFVRNRRSHDAAAMIIEYVPTNKKAAKLYRRLGFKPIRNKFLIQKL